MSRDKSETLNEACLLCIVPHMKSLFSLVGPQRPLCEHLEVVMRLLMGVTLHYTSLGVFEYQKSLHGPFCEYQKVVVRLSLRVTLCCTSQGVLVFSMVLGPLL